MASNRIARRLTILTVTLSSFALRATSAWAQPYPGGGQTPPEVGGEQFFRGGHIPRTGTDILLFLLIALILVVIGIALHVVYRNRAAASGGD